MLPSTSLLIRKDLVEKEKDNALKVGPPPNSYDELLRANQKLVSARSTYIFENTKTKIVGSTLTAGSSILNKLLPNPIIEGLFDFTKNEWLEYANDGDKQQFQGAVERTFSEYTGSYLKNHPTASTKEISEHFSVFVKSDLIKADDYSLVGKKIDAYVLDYIVANEEKFKQLEDQVKAQASTGNTQPNTENIIKVSTEAKKDMEQAVRNVEKANWGKVISYQKSFENFQKKVTNDLSKVYDDMENMQKEVTDNKVRIEKNTQDISKIKSDISVIKTDVQLVKANMDRINQLQVENRSLINENLYKTNVIASVLYNNVDTKSQLQLIRTGVVKVKDSTKEVTRLERMQRIATADRYIKIAGESVQLAENLGLDPKDAERMNKILGGLAVVTKLSYAYASGDVLAGLEGVNMAFSVFGSSKPKPNPEFVAIMEQFKIVNQKLDVINSKIDSLSHKLNTIIQLELDLHAETMEQLSEVQSRLIDIEQKTEYIIEILTGNTITGINDDYINEYRNRLKNCGSLDELRGHWNFDEKLPTLLKALFRHTQDTVIQNKPYLHFNAKNSTLDIQTKLYKPLLDVVEKYRLNNPDYSTTFLPSAIYLPKYAGQANRLYNEFKTSTGTQPGKLYIAPSDLKTFLNAAGVTRLAELLLVFEPYLYYGSGSDFKTMPASDFFTGNNDNIITKNNRSRQRFSNLLHFCNISLIQQNILNGGPNIEVFYQFLTQNMPVDAETHANILLALKETNYFFKSNLSTYILHNAIASNKALFSRFQELYNNAEKITPADERLQTLNSFLNLQYMKLVPDEQQKFVFNLQLPGQPVIKLPVQVPQIILNNEMIYPSDVYGLYDTRLKLINRLIEYDFMKSIEGDPKVRNIIYTKVLQSENSQNN